MGSYVAAADRGPVRWLTLTQPDKKNAIPRHGWDEIVAAVTEFAESAQRVLVLTGSGEDFCSGADLESAPQSHNPVETRQLMRGPQSAATALYRLAKPSIAAVDGAAMGAGMNLALGCDIVIASERAQFAELFVRRGLALDFGGTWLLPRLVGLARARELALTGRAVDAAEALRVGMVSAVVAPAELHDVVQETALRLASGAPLAQQFVKLALSRSHELTFEQAAAFEAQLQTVLLTTDDVAEGIAAFLDGRSPEFRGR